MAKLKLRVFLSSPGDVGDERRMALRVMERLQGEFSAVLELEPIVWEHEPVRATATFQTQIPEPAKADVLLCVLWSRLGTRLPGEFKRDDGTVYDSGTAFELETALIAFQKKGHPDILVYRKTAPPLFDVSNRDERELRSRQWDQLSDYLKHWFFNPDGSFKAGFTQFSRLDEFEELLERHLRRVIEERLKEENIALVGVSQALPTWLKGSPFRGLAAFDVEHAEIFHGRTRAIAEAKDRLQRRAAEMMAEAGEKRPGTAFLLITGMSGSGKSSLVRAGLIPTVTTPGTVEGIGLWRYGILRPSEGVDPLAALVGALYGRTALPELAQGDFTPETLTDLLGRMPEQGLGPIRRALQRVAEALQQQEKLSKPPAARLLLLIDQLEELFTDERFSPEDRQRFVAVLEQLANSGVVWVVATLRSDFYHRCLELPTLARLKDGPGTYDLLPPQGPEIAQMIRAPARAAGLAFEEDASRGGLDDELQQTAAKNPASLPLLSFVLDELYDACQQTRRLTFAAYESLGGLEGAIAKRADDVVKALTRDVLAALPALLRALITLARDDGVATARTVLKSQAVHGPAAEALVKALVEARLLVTGGEGDDTVLRVAHEALLTRWPRARAIVADNREFLQARARLTADAERWEEEKRSLEELLPSGKRLIEAKEVLLVRRDELDPTLCEYIDTSLAAERAREEATQAEARRKLRRARLAAVVGIVLALIAGGGAFYGITGQQEAEKQAQEALRQRGIAEERAVEAQEAQQLAEERAIEAKEAEALAEQRAIEAREAQALAEANAAEARRNLQEVLRFQSKTLALESRRQTLDGNAILGELLALEGLPKRGETQARPYVAEAESALKVALAAQNGLATYRHYESIYTVDISPDGRRLVTGSQDFTARVWDLYGATEIAVLKGHSGPIGAVTFSPDGRLVATASDDGTARVWDAASGEELARMEGHEGEIWMARFSPEGRRLATYGRDRTARVWDVASGRQIALFDKHGDDITNVEFSPDGTRLATSSLDESVRVWDSASGQELFRFGDEQNGAIRWVEWSPTGDKLLIADDNTAAELYDGATGEYLYGFYRRHEAALTQARFSPDGAYVATADLDGVVRLWNAETGGHIVDLRGHGCNDKAECSVRGLEFSPDSRLIITLGADDTVRLWDAVTSRETLVVFTGHRDRISAADFSPDSSKVVTASWDGTARLWEVGASSSKAILGWRANWMTHAAFSPDGKLVAVASGNEGVLQLWDTATGEFQGVLPWHNGEITRLEFSPDGRRLLSSSYDWTAAIWDMAAYGTDQAVERLVSTSHDGVVRYATFSPDGRLWATASNDKTARILDVETGEIMATLVGHQDNVRGIRFSADGKRVVTASDDDTAIVWEVATGRPVITLEGHSDSVTFAEFSPDGNQVATGSFDGWVGVWDLATGEAAQTFQAFDYDVLTVAFSRDGKTLLATGAGGGRLYDLASGNEIAQLPHDRKASYGEFSRDGSRILTVSDDGTARLWSAKDGTPLASLEEHEGPIYYGTWSRAGDQVVTVSEDGTAKLWNPLSGASRHTLTNLKDEYWDAGFSPDGKWLVGGGYINLHVWNAETGRREYLLPGHRDRIVRIVFSKDGERMVTTSLDGNALVYNTEDFSLVSTISHYNAIYDADFSGDSTLLITVDSSGQVAIWDGRDATLISLLEGHSDRVNSGRFNPANKHRVVTASDDGTARVWDTESGKALLTLEGHGDWVNEAIYSPDGKKIVTASADGTAKIWDARSGALLFTLEGHLKALWDVTFSPDGKLVATASSDSTARLWDAATGKQLFVLQAQAATMNRLAFSPEGDHIVTVSADGAARVWDTQTGVLVATLTGHQGSILEAEFSPDGRSLATGGQDGRVRVWRLYTGTNLVDMARALLPRQLTAEERERFSLPPEEPAQRSGFAPTPTLQ